MMGDGQDRYTMKLSVIEQAMDTVTQYQIYIGYNDPQTKKASG